MEAKPVDSDELSAEEVTKIAASLKKSHQRIIPLIIAFIVLQTISLILITHGHPALGFSADGILMLIMFRHIILTNREVAAYRKEHGRPLTDQEMECVERGLEEEEKREEELKKEQSNGS